MIALEIIADMTPYLAGCVLFVVFTFLCGQAVLTRLNSYWAGGAEKFFICTTVGAGMLILGLFVLGMTQSLNAEVVLVVAAVAALLSVLKLWPEGHLQSDLRNLAATAKGWASAPIMVVLVFMMLPYLIVPLLPAVHADELSYHLPYARDFVNAHGIYTDLYLRYPFFVLNYDLLYTVALMFSDEIMAHYLHAIAALLMAAGVFGLGRQLGSRWIGWGGVACFLLCPLTLFMSGYAYIDLGLAWFVFAAVYCLLMWHRNRVDAWLWVGAGLAGIGAGCKYSGLAFAFGILCWVALETRSWRKTAACLGLVVLLGSPWYVRNLILCGNPVSPFAGQWFGYGPWNAQDMISQNQELARGGVTKNLLQLARLPWDLISKPLEFHEGRLLPLYIVGLYGSALFWLWRGPVRRIALFILLTVCVWFYTIQIKRYLAPIFPLLSVYTTWLLAYLIRPAGPAFTRLALALRLRWRVWGYAAQCVVAAGLVLWGIYYIDHKKFGGDSFPTTPAARLAYAEKQLQGFKAMLALNKLPGGRIYSMGCEVLRFHSNKQLIGDWFGVARYGDVLELQDDNQALSAHLQKLNCSYLLLLLRPPFDIREKLDSTYFEPVYLDSEAAVFRIRSKVIEP